MFDLLLYKSHLTHTVLTVLSLNTPIMCRVCVFMYTEQVHAHTNTHTDTQEGECWAEMQVLSSKSYNLAGKPTFISALFIIFICSFELTCDNLSSQLTCSDSHASAESLLIRSKHGITYGINSSRCHVFIYLLGLRVTRASVIISPVRVLFFFCQLRDLGISQALPG